MTPDATPPGGALAVLAWCDVGAVLRTRPVPLDTLPARKSFGMGWAAAGWAITPFDELVANDWGPTHELRQVPVDGACVSVPGEGDWPALHLHLARALEPGGAPADCCPRNFCTDVLARLESETGLALWAAFEHEFTVLAAPFAPGPVYSVETLRRAARFAAAVTAALRPLGLECFEPEFGRGQFEVSCAPQPGVAAADHAILTREVIREVARRQGVRLSFAPKVAPDAVGNGMHVHFSLRDRAGRPVLYDGSRPARLSATGAAFAAGVLRHIDALTGFSAPTPVSYLRLGPAHWSCGYSAFGVQNREAALRVCPSPDPEPEACARATNLELRVPDGSCNPHLALGALAAAGLAGVREGLPLPPIVSVDPGSLAKAERERLGIRPLPGSLGAALAAIEADRILGAAVPARLLRLFLAIKRAELAQFAATDPAGLCAAYSRIF